MRWRHRGRFAIVLSRESTAKRTSDCCQNACDVMSRKTGAKTDCVLSSRARHFRSRISSEGSLSQLSSQCPTALLTMEASAGTKPPARSGQSSQAKADSPLAEDGRDSEWILIIRKSAVISFRKSAKEERNSARKALLRGGWFWRVLDQPHFERRCIVEQLSRPLSEKLPKSQRTSTLPNALCLGGMQ